MAFWLVCLPGSRGDQNAQARFDKSLKDATSLTKVEIEWLDTLYIRDPATLKVLNISKESFLRTFKYSYILSGTKFRATCELVSGSETNLSRLRESAFDGSLPRTCSCSSWNLAKVPGGLGIRVSVQKLGRQPLSYTFVWENLGNAALKARIGHVSSPTFRHTHRTWLDSVGTPVGVQQNLMRHADICTTMNIYGDTATADTRDAHEKVVRA